MVPEKSNLCNLGIAPYETQKIFVKRDFSLKTAVKIPITVIFPKLK